MTHDKLANSVAVASGRFLAARGELAVFAPVNTSYQLHLKGVALAAEGQRTSVVIEAKGRKVLTVPTGGNFISPIQGPPRVVQGRVKAIEGGYVVVQAGLPVRVQLPVEDNAVDLNNGAISVGSMVNITLQPGATFSAA